MRSSIISTILFSVVLSGSAFAQVKDEVAEIERLSDAFELARLNLDVRSATGLVSPEALAFQSNGRAAGNLLGGLEDRSKRKTTQTIPEAVRVLDRTISVQGNVAIVAELLGATADINGGMKNKPRRRLVTWAKTGDGWKIVGMHSSPYDHWEPSIAAYEKLDEAARYAPGGIVFVGSSSVRGWKTLATDFPDLPVLGRGFGGSQLIDSVMYAHRIVTPYQPSAVAVYAGDNDIAAGNSADRVFRDFKMLVDTIHTADPEIRIGFIAIKPSLKRWEMWGKMKTANEKVAKFAETQERVTYLDIVTPMLGENGRPRPDLFVKDGLHMTRSGYEIWTNVLMPWAKGE